MEIEFDPAKNKINIAKHGVDFAEAASCLDDQAVLVRPDPDAEGEQRFVLVGMSSQYRLLTVVYTLRGEDVVRLISARLSTKKEVSAYER